MLSVQTSAAHRHRVNNWNCSVQYPWLAIKTPDKTLTAYTSRTIQSTSPFLLIPCLGCLFSHFHGFYAKNRDLFGCSMQDAVPASIHCACQRVVCCCGCLEISRLKPQHTARWLCVDRIPAIRSLNEGLGFTQRVITPVGILSWHVGKNHQAETIFPTCSAKLL